MIAVPVGDEDEIRINRICFDHRSGIVVQERIHEQLNTIYVEPKGGMSVPGNFEWHVSLLILVSESSASIDLSAVTCQSERSEPLIWVSIRQQVGGPEARVGWSLLA
jgi:hypothetical protein